MTTSTKVDQPQVLTPETVTVGDIFDIDFDHDIFVTPEGCGFGYKVIKETVEEQSRWAVLYFYILERDDRTFWFASVRKAATENQDTDTEEKIELQRVYPHTVEVIEYKDHPQVCQA